MPLKEVNTKEAPVEARPRKIFDLYIKALLVGLLLILLTGASSSSANAEIAFVRVDVQENANNSEVRARLRAKKKIYYRLITDSILFSKNTPSNLKDIITGIYYRNYIEKIRINGFKEISRKTHGKRIEYTYSYQKIVLLKINSSDLLNSQSQSDTPAFLSGR